MPQALTYTVDLETRKAIAGAQALAKELKSNLASAAGTAGNAISGMIAPLAALAGGYLSCRFAADQFSSAIHQAADMETMQVGFATLLRSGQAAKDMLAGLAHFADTTPMKLPELAAATRTLLAFGDPANRVMTDLRQIGDIAAGVQAPIGEIAELFGKAKTEGTLFSIDLREMTRRGIPIIGELAKQFGVSENSIHKMAEMGRIKFADLQTAFNNLTGSGGMFFHMLQNQSMTANGLLSTLEDAVDAVYRQFGAPLLDPFKKILTEGITYISSLKEKAAEWGQVLANAANGFIAIFKNGDALGALTIGLKLGFAEAVDTLYKGLVATIATVGTGLGNAAGVLTDALGKPEVWKLIGDGLSMAAYKFLSIMEKGVADTFAQVPGMSGIAKDIRAQSAAAAQQSDDSKGDVQIDLSTSAVKDTFNEAVAAAKETGKVFTDTFKNTGDVIHTHAMRNALTRILWKANDSDGLEAPSGLGLGNAFGDMLGAHKRPPKAPDPEPEGTIGGFKESEVMAKYNRPASQPWYAPMLPPSSLNDRANSMVHGATDRHAETTARNTGKMVDILTQVMNRIVPQYAKADSGKFGAS